MTTAKKTIQTLQQENADLIDRNTRLHAEWRQMRANCARWQYNAENLEASLAGDEALIAELRARLHHARTALEQIENLGAEQMPDDPTATAMFRLAHDWLKLNDLSCPSHNFVPIVVQTPPAPAPS